MWRRIKSSLRTISYLRQWVVIGGTSLKGGHGTILGSLIGALTIATLGNGMDLLGVSSFYQMVLKGLVIVFAVAIDRGQAERA